MAQLRRHLQLWVAAWLVVQVASLSALLPRDCCAAHRPAASSAKPACHEKAAAIQCPMRAADGTPCPMHRGDHSEAADASRDGCAMRSTCRGPMAALFAQLSNHGILTDQFQLLLDPHAGSAGVRPSENLITRLAPPDTPPPRA